MLEEIGPGSSVPFRVTGVRSGRELEREFTACPLPFLTPSGPTGWHLAAYNFAIRRTGGPVFYPWEWPFFSIFRKGANCIANVQNFVLYSTVVFVAMGDCVSDGFTAWGVRL